MGTKDHEDAPSHENMPPEGLGPMGFRGQGCLYRLL